MDRRSKPVRWCAFFFGLLLAACGEGATNLAALDASVDRDGGESVPDSGTGGSACEVSCTMYAGVAEETIATTISTPPDEVAQCETPANVMASCVERCEDDFASLSEMERYFEDYVACWFGDDRPQATCVSGDETFDVDVLKNGVKPTPVGTDGYVGTATVVTVDPLVLWDGQELWEISMPLSNEPPIADGQQVEVYLRHYCPFYCEIETIIIWDLDGVVVLAGWDTFTHFPAIPELGLSYDWNDCVSFQPDPERSGRILTRDLVLQDGTRVGPGTSYVTDDYLYRNSASTFTFGVRASDQRPYRPIGTLERIAP